MTEPDDLPRDPKLSRLYRQGSRAEPPAALDAAILAAAQRSARPRRTPWWQRLQVPVALAATVMLTVMLTLTMERNPPQEAAPSTAPLPAPAPVAVPEPRQSAEPPPVAAKKPVPVINSVTEKEAPRQSLRKDQASAPKADAAATAGASAPPPPAADVGTAAAGAAAQPRPPAAAAMPLPPPAGYNQAAPPAAPARSGEGTVELREERKALAAPAPAAGAAPAPAMADRAAAKREKATPNPAEWIEEIRALRRQGVAQEAERRLKEFRAAYPDYPLPEDLR